MQHIHPYHSVVADPSGVILDLEKLTLKAYYKKILL